MKLFKKTTPKNFSDWFEIASAGFSEGVKERIWSEIKNHYVEAVEREMARGFSEAEAQANALAELGAANAVARSFRKRYLTVREARQVARARKLAANQFILICGYLVGACSMMVILLEGDPGAERLVFPREASSLIFMFSGLLVFALFPTMAFVLARGDSSHRKTRLIFLLNCIGGGWIGFLPFMPDVFGPYGRHPSVWGIAMTVMLIARRLWPLRFWRKVWDAYPDETLEA
jgi:hypothetical protein